MIVTEFVRLVDQRVEESGINRTLLISNSGMTASGISKILTKGQGSQPLPHQPFGCCVGCSPENTIPSGRISAPRAGRGSTTAIERPWIPVLQAFLWKADYCYTKNEFEFKKFLHYQFNLFMNTVQLDASVRSFYRWPIILRFRNTSWACSGDRNRKATIYLLVPNQ